MDNNKCVFDTGSHSKGCNALSEKVCKIAECPFFKPANEYKLTYDGHIEKRGNE